MKSVSRQKWADGFNQLIVNSKAKNLNSKAGTTESKRF